MHYNERKHLLLTYPSHLFLFSGHLFLYNLYYKYTEEKTNYKYAHIFTGIIPPTQAMNKETNCDDLIFCNSAVIYMYP